MNKIFDPNKKYYKLINSNPNYHDYEILGGLDLNKQGMIECESTASSPIYFYDVLDIYDYLDIGQLLYEVTIPRNVKVTSLPHVFKTKKAILRKIGNITDPNVIDEIKDHFIFTDLLDKIAECGHSSVMKYFYNRGLLENMDLNRLLLLSVLNGSIEMVDLLHSYGADPTENNNKAIMVALELDHPLDMIKYLHSIGSDIFSRDNEALCYSIRKRHFDVASYILDNGADPNVRDNTPLKYAIIYGGILLIDLLYEKGADLNAVGLTTKIAARFNGNNSILALDHYHELLRRNESV